MNSSNTLSVSFTAILNYIYQIYLSYQNLMTLARG